MPSRRRRRFNWALIIILIAVAALAGGIAFLVNVSNSCQGLPFPSIAGQGLAEHYHAQLLIFVNGNEITLPEGIGEGDVGGCPQPLHNHVSGPNTNVIHVESPTLTQYTLGDFFRVWAATPNVQGPKPEIFTQSQLFNYTAANGYEIRMFVNGQPSSEFGALVLQDHQTIVIAYGKSSTTDWSSYQALSGKPWPYQGL